MSSSEEEAKLRAKAKALGFQLIPIEQTGEFLKSKLSCERTTWRKREAYALENELLHVVTLTGGGHIAELRFRDGTGSPVVSPLWVPPWKTSEPYRYHPEGDASRYGPTHEGKLLLGIAGHNLCLDFFGPPSDEE